MTSAVQSSRHLLPIFSTQQDPRTDNTSFSMAGRPALDFFDLPPSNSILPPGTGKGAVAGTASAVVVLATGYVWAAPVAWTCAASAFFGLAIGCGVGFFYYSHQENIEKKSKANEMAQRVRNTISKSNVNDLENLIEELKLQKAKVEDVDLKKEKLLNKLIDEAQSQLIKKLKNDNEASGHVVHQQGNHQHVTKGVNHAA